MGNVRALGGAVAPEGLSSSQMPKHWPIGDAEIRRRCVAAAVIAGEIAGIRVDSIMSRDRSHSVSRARRLAFYIARHMTGASFPELGRAFGRDHSTVQEGLNRTGRELQQHPKLRERLGRIIAGDKTAALGPDGERAVVFLCQPLGMFPRADDGAGQRPCSSYMATCTRGAKLRRGGGERSR